MNPSVPSSPSPIDPTSPLPPHPRQWMGHPFGLYVLFLTEMWERFSYYGMRALLVYYMSKSLLTPAHAHEVIGHRWLQHGLEWLFGPMQVHTLASHIYGLYTALVYITPLLGGILADRFWGKRKCILVGSVLMAIGHFMMSFRTLFYPALLFLILGNGTFKPNISTQVSTLYTKEDPRRPRAFNLFYVGINLGAFFAPLLCGFLGETYGWHYGFGTASAGMMAGLVFYLWGQRYLPAEQPPEHSPLRLSAEQKKHKKLAAFTLLASINIAFWAVFEQMGNTLALWADGYTDRHLFQSCPYEIPASWFQSVNPLFIFLLTPLINAIWSAQARKQSELSHIQKMILGCFLLGIAFWIMVASVHTATPDTGVSAVWLVGCIFLLTLAELHVSPVGLALVTKIAPAHMTSRMMGGWMLSMSVGNYLSGYLGSFWEKMPKEHFFALLAGLAWLTAAFLMGFHAFLHTALEEKPSRT